MQYSFIMVKPGFTVYANEIIEKIASHTNATILGQKQFRLTPALCDEHYSHIKHKPFFAGNQEYMMSGDVVGAILVRADGNLTDDIRTIVGDTRGETAGTLRHHYRKLIGGGEIWANAVHCSGYDADGRDEGETECRRFAEILGVKL